MGYSNFRELINGVKNLPPCKAVVAAAQDAHTLEGVFHAAEDDLIQPLLVGDGEKILALCGELGVSLSRDSVVEADGPEECARKAVELIRRGQGELLIKGLLPTGTLLKEVVNRERGIRAAELLSHVAILQVPAYHKLMFLTDGGMVTAPGLAQKRAILSNALSLCRFLGNDCPKAAILCAAEAVNPQMPETMDAAALKEEAIRGDFGLCLVEGPISLDLATDPEAARIKGYKSPVAGDADVFLVPNITAGNLLGKALYGFAGGKMAGVVLGATVPITVNSRAARPEEKYDSILIAAAMAAGKKGDSHG